MTVEHESDCSFMRELEERDVSWARELGIRCISGATADVSTRNGAA